MGFCHHSPNLFQELHGDRIVGLSWGERHLTSLSQAVFGTTVDDLLVGEKSGALRRELHTPLLPTARVTRSGWPAFVTQCSCLRGPPCIGSRWV